MKLAKKINGEIINADSMQVYKELKILSARPNLKDYQSIKHHLYGFHSVKNNFSTGDWLKTQLSKTQGQPPLLCQTRVKFLKLQQINR
ncbi:hypothetical protein OAS15_04005 [Candidatus Pelagibacter sp.]|nr:hypothetical protein [Candidatus Pelagibacter sp.]